jgi:hypothetical protein
MNIQDALKFLSEENNIYLQQKQRDTGTGQMLAQQRAQIQASRHGEAQKEYMELQQNSRAYVPIISTPVEDDFPIKFNYKDRSCKEFHSLMERERGESKPNVDLRYRIAKLLILGLVLQLIVEIVR